MRVFLLISLLGAAFASSSLPYNGGELLTNTVEVYIVWYGSWAQSNPVIASTQNLIAHIGSSTYWNTISKYTDANGVPASSNITFAKSIYVNSPYGNAWGTNDYSPQLIFAAMKAGVFPASANNVYYVMLSPDVTMDGLCSNFCGYHSFFTVTTNIGTQLKLPYAIIGSPQQCPRGCSISFQLKSYQAQYASAAVNDYSPAEVVVHELAESITDPTFVGYVNNNGNVETGDICANELSDVHMAANGTLFDVTINGQNYMLASLFDTALGACVMEPGVDAQSYNVPPSQWSSAITHPPSPPASFMPTSASRPAFVPVVSLLSLLFAAITW